MITEVNVQNYRSIWQAKVQLQPFSLLIGANGTGKTNFLYLLQDISEQRQVDLTNKDGNQAIYRVVDTRAFKKHFNYTKGQIQISFKASPAPNSNRGIRPNHLYNKVKVFTINSERIGGKESLVSNPTVKPDGSGSIQVLDALKTGDREDLFEMIESSLKRYVPEIEKLSFTPQPDKKMIQIREKYISSPIPLSELSEGTRLILTILTIIYQENPPKVICLEDIDRGMHPRLLQRLIELCFDVTREGNIQIIATTHNPYLVNLFHDHEDAVVIVEKEKGETQFTTLAERMEGLTLEEDDPLGELWFAGFVGGVPKMVGAV